MQTAYNNSGQVVSIGTSPTCFNAALPTATFVRQTATMSVGQFLWIDNDEKQDVMRAKARAHSARRTNEKRFEDYTRHHRRRTVCKRSSGFRPVPVQFDNTVLTLRCIGDDRSDKEYTESDSSETRTEQQQNDVASPPRWQGNSDPFRSQAIVFTPLVTGLVNFFLTVWLPSKALRAENEAKWSSAQHVRGSIRQLTLSTLRSEEGFMSTVLLSATVLGNLSPSPEVERERLQWKLKYINRLKHNLATSTLHEQDVDHNLIRLTQTLYTNAVTEQAMQEARYHGNALQCLWQKKTERCGMGAVEMKTVILVSAYELYRAGLTFTPAVIDTRSFLPKILSANFPQEERIMLNNRNRWYANLDPVLVNTPLYDICTDMFTCYWMSTLPQFRHSPQWQTLRSFYRQLVTIDYYLVARLKAEEKASQYWHTQACLALCLTICTLLYVSDVHVAGRPYWPLGEKLTTALQFHLREALALAVPSAGPESPALIMAAWAGAMWTLKNPDPSEELLPYFSQVFAEMTSAAGITSWEQFDVIFHGFVPCPIPEKLRGF